MCTQLAIHPLPSAFVNECEPYLLHHLILPIQLRRTLNPLHPFRPTLNIHFNLRRLLVQRRLIIEDSSLDPDHIRDVWSAAGAVESRAAGWAKVGVDFLEAME